MPFFYFHDNWFVGFPLKKTITNQSIINFKRLLSQRIIVIPSFDLKHLKKIQNRTMLILSPFGLQGLLFHYENFRSIWQWQWLVWWYRSYLNVVLNPSEILLSCRPQSTIWPRAWPAPAQDCQTPVSLPPSCL